MKLIFGMALLGAAIGGAATMLPSPCRHEKVVVEYKGIQRTVTIHRTDCYKVNK